MAMVQKFILVFCIFGVFSTEFKEYFNEPAFIERRDRNNKIVESFSAQQKEEMHKNPFGDEIWELMRVKIMVFEPNSRLTPDFIAKARQNWWDCDGKSEAENFFNSLPPNDSEFQRQMQYDDIWGRRIPPDEMDKFRFRSLEREEEELKNILIKNPKMKNSSISPKSPKSQVKYPDTPWNAPLKGSKNEEDQQSNRSFKDSDSEDEEKHNPDQKDEQSGKTHANQNNQKSKDSQLHPALIAMFFFIAVCLFVLSTRGLINSIRQN